MEVSRINTAILNINEQHLTRPQAHEFPALFRRLKDVRSTVMLDCRDSSRYLIGVTVMRTQPSRFGSLRVCKHGRLLIG